MCMTSSGYALTVFLYLRCRLISAGARKKTKGSYLTDSECNYFQADETGHGPCEIYQLHCDGDKCVDPEQMCDGIQQCDSGLDEKPGICKK